MLAQSQEFPDPENVCRQLERILCHRTFRESGAPARLLRFTVEETLAGRSAEIKEYTLGANVLGRGLRFDPKLDTIVRVQFRRLRAKLQQYYANEGRGDQILIAYEKGGYVPQVRVRRAETPSPAPPASIAVLPFRDISGKPDEMYFGEGLAEELIQGLSRIPGLKVVTRTSAFQFRGGTDARDIGCQLGVQTIIEGSVRRSENRLRLSVRLVNTADGFTLWSSGYERRTEDVFAVQEELAQSIIANLGTHLGASIGDAAKPRRTKNVEVYYRYLMGRHHWNQLGPDSLNRAIECFRQVIAQEPSYGPAYAGLADCYIALAGNGYASPHEVMPKAKQAAIEAIALDATLGEAHTALAKVTEDYDWKVSEAEPIYLRAIGLNPGYAVAHYYYSMYLTSSGRHAEAFDEIHKAQELDPLSPIINWAAGFLLQIEGRLPEALEQYSRANDLIPRNPDTLRFLMLGAAHTGRYLEIESALRQDELAGNDVVSRIVVAGIHGAHGRIAEGLRILAQVERQSTSVYTPPIAVSTAYIALGQADRALAWLEQAFAQRCSKLLTLGADPLFQSLCPDQRFQLLLERIASIKQ
jgi:serine/threonine-protein kinase